MWRYLSLSLVLHGLFVLVFWLVSSRPMSPKMETVQVEFLERTKNAAEGKSKSATTGKVNLKRLLPRFGIGKPKKVFSLQEGNEDLHEDEVGGFANKMSLKNQMETMYFYEAVWRKINEKFYYPLELAKMYISGDVVVHVEVDKQGTFKGQLLKLQATNQLLEVFVLGVVMQALKHPLHERFWHTQDGMIPLSLTFHFGTYLEGYIEPKGGILKNRLQFERFVQMEPQINKKFRDFFLEHNIPMLIPIPGGAMLDVVQAVRLVMNIGKPGPKALEQIKRNELKMQFESTLKDAQY